jgi:hypothetical protein
VARLRQGLLAPGTEEIERLLPEVEAAAQSLRSVDADSARQCAADLRALKRELRHAAGLIHSGAAFYQGWMRVLAAASGGYTASGEAAVLQAPSRVSLEG